MLVRENLITNNFAKFALRYVSEYKFSQKNHN